MDHKMLYTCMEIKVHFQTVAMHFRLAHYDLKLQYFPFILRLLI